MRHLIKIYSRLEHDYALKGLRLLQVKLVQDKRLNSIGISLLCPRSLKPTTTDRGYEKTIKPLPKMYHKFK